MTWVLDLDGVVWLGPAPIAGSAEAVAALRAAGEQVVFVTNNSSAPPSVVEAKLEGMGIPADGAVVTSGMVVATLVAPGERVLCCGGPGLAAALADAGAAVVPFDGRPRGRAAPDEPVDAVVVGYHADFGYDRMAIAAAAVRDGARLLASNDDATYPTDEGILPGCGAILAGIERAAGVTATVAGKPNPPMVAYLQDRFGLDGWVVGDRLDTDGRLGHELGWHVGVVLSGVATAADAAAFDPAPTLVAADLAELVRTALD